MYGHFTKMWFSLTFRTWLFYLLGYTLQVGKLMLIIWMFIAVYTKTDGNKSGHLYLNNGMSEGLFTCQHVIYSSTCTSVWKGSFSASLLALISSEVACECALSETVFIQVSNSQSCCLLYYKQTWHFFLLLPVETSRCFPFQLNPLKSSLLYCNHWPVLSQGMSKLTVQHHSTSYRGRGVKENVCWLTKSMAKIYIY